MSDIISILNFLLISKDDFGKKGVVISQLKLINEKFDKRPEWYNFAWKIIKTKFLNNLKITTRSENFDLNTVENLNYNY